MASLTTTEITETATQNTPERPRGGGGRTYRGHENAGGLGVGRGRGFGRGGAGGGGRGRWGRGRGRGAEDFRQTSNPTTSLQQSLRALNLNGPAKEDESGDGTVDESVCFICANQIVYYSITPCGHSTCHICSLRMRALYGNKACAHCRTETDFVVFAENEDRKYDQFEDALIAKADADLGIKYATAAIHDDTVLLLRYNCPEPSCDVACLGWKNLHTHVRNTHDRVLCRLCTRNKKVFTHEHSLFTFPQLKKHEREGDDMPGSSDQSGFKGHPECGFCRERFYSSDELYSHCREAHERCFICDRRNYSQNQQYYLNYDALVVHFHKEHFMCPEQECLEKKFVVFESDVDLKAHQLETHPDGLSKAAKRDARRIDMAQFETSRGRGRGRDPNSDLPPTRAEQPMRRDEIAYQRETAYQRTLAVQSSQSTTSRTFGGQLTQPNGPAVVAQPTPAQAQRPVPIQTTAIPPVRGPAPSQFPPLASTQAPSATVTPAQPPVPAPASQFPPLGRTQSPAPQNLPSQFRALPPSPVDEAKRQRHAMVIERASNLLKHDRKKLDTFKTYVSEYRVGVQTAREVCDSFWSLFDTNANDLGILIRALAELYDDENKRIELLAAWNSWKAVSEDYPPISGVENSNTASKGARVLKIKSSTTPSARSARQGAWGSAATPIVRPAASLPVSREGGSATSSSLWMTPTTGTATLSRPTVATSISYASPPAAAPISRAPSAVEFPSLPPKQPLHNFGPVIRNGASGGRGIVNAWTASGQQSPAEPEPEPEEATGKKKKGKQKQTLFHFG